MQADEFPPDSDSDEEPERHRKRNRVEAPTKTKPESPQRPRLPREVEPHVVHYSTPLVSDCKAAHVEAADEGRRQAEATVKELTMQVETLTKALHNLKAKIKFHCTQKYRIQHGMRSTLLRLEHIADDEAPIPQHPCDCGKPPQSRGRHPNTCASVGGVPQPVCDCQKVGPRSRHFPTCATKRTNPGEKRLRGDDITKVVADLRDLLKTSAATCNESPCGTKVASSDLTAPVLLRCGFLWRGTRQRGTHFEEACEGCGARDEQTSFHT